jgi:para-aminobenzoate synthetase component 1
MGSNARFESAVTAPAALDLPAQAPEVVAEDSLPPDLVFAGVARRPCPVYLWGDGQPDKGRYSIVAHTPRAVLTSQRGRTVLVADGRSRVLEGPPLAHVESLASRYGESVQELPFVGGAIGYITYEHACEAEGVHLSRGPLPDLCFAFYDSAYVFDHVQSRGYWVGTSWPPGADELARARPQLSEWTAAVTRAQYVAHVEHILEQIAAGNLYQANYTQRWTAEGTVDEQALALEFRRTLPSPLGAYLGFPGGHIWSLSPERLLSGRRGDYLESRPIKGTRPRHARPQRDFDLGLELSSHPKDRAELLMIVDLVRNDLGKVASAGSVSVPTLYGLQSYSNVHHLEAVVRSDFPRHKSWAQALAAILPGGSVTGAPKRSAVELLARLEPVPRSVYTGAIGYLSYHGAADFNLPIRTLYRVGRRFYLHAGGGIVADSGPETEYEESVLKIGHIMNLLRSL